MCGIVGSIGTNKSNDIVLEGLRRLEYRGYDSCGITYVDNNELKVVKSISRIAELRAAVTTSSTIALGHTRWATHGGVNLENAHPHLTSDKKMAIVHNGVIENYLELKANYGADYDFKSQTDTEVLLCVLNKLYAELGDINLAIQKFMEIVKGSYGLILYVADFKDTLFAIKHKSPMLVGRADDFYTISSDPSAVIDQVNDFYQIEDHRFLKISKDEISMFDEKGVEQPINFEKIDMEYEEISTFEYDSFMHKEIEEQPKALRNIVENYQTLGFDQDLQATLRGASRIMIVACGTSYNAGLICKDIIQEKLMIPTEVVIASEYGYESKIIADGSVFIFLSQSGETADSMLVFNQVKGKYPIIAITNVRGSQMDRNADFSLQLFAGVEIAVASTKAYTAQIAVLAALVYTAANDNSIFEKLLNVADYQEKVIASAEQLKKYAEILKSHREVFYLGRLSDYYVAQECALKIKEITYLNICAMASGELKHGTISLIDEDKYVVALVTNPKIAENTRSNIEEVRARNGNVLIFSTSKTQVDGDDFVIEYDGDDLLTPLVSVIPHQYLSLFIAQILNLDIDKPRNLAKAVTVE